MRILFPKALRLLTSKDYQAVFERSRRSRKKSIHRPGFRLVVCPQLTDSPRLGFIISKKNVAKAVERNRIKRVIRESFRQNQHQLHHDVIVIANKGASIQRAEDIRTSMTESWGYLSSDVGEPEQSRPMNA